MSTYLIQVSRQKSEGELRFAYNSLVVKTTCWWDLNNKIPAGTYRGCSATTMSTKRNSAGGAREGIFIPGVPGHSQIFIHMGTSAAWSDGCIVIDETEMLRIYNAITPKNGHNVTVEISD